MEIPSPEKKSEKTLIPQHQSNKEIPTLKFNYQKVIKNPKNMHKLNLIAHKTPQECLILKYRYGALLITKDDTMKFKIEKSKA